MSKLHPHRYYPSGNTIEVHFQDAVQEVIHLAALSPEARLHYLMEGIIAAHAKAKGSFILNEFKARPGPPVRRQKNKEPSDLIRAIALVRYEEKLATVGEDVEITNDALEQIEKDALLYAQSLPPDVQKKLRDYEPVHEALLSIRLSRKVTSGARTIDDFITAKAA